MSSKSTNRTEYSGNSTGRSRHGTRAVAQTFIDAKLHENYEESKMFFDYSVSINLNSSSFTGDSNVSAYHQRIQIGMLIQPFGCMIAVDGQNLNVLAYSENAPEMLGLASHVTPSTEKLVSSLTIGTNVQTLFQSSGAAAIQKSVNFGEVAFLNPLLVHSVKSGNPFYAILHRIELGFVIDLEPVLPADVPVTAAGALKSYKLAAKSISKLQSLPSGNMSLLCDVLVKEISELTGYDRVMVYKFHEDEHGEVIAESCKPDMDPYLGLHYPATDIPQASRFLFMKNRVRMICDCLAQPVKVIQDKKLVQPVSISGSTLRAPHGCHAQYMNNMGSSASLVMSVAISDNDEAEVDGDGDGLSGRKLWGLVVCHHRTPRFVPFPLRYACEFLIQVFGVHVSKEVELAAQSKERHILKIQTVLCDMLLRDVPLGIMTKSPNVMDLVKCDGAALYHKKKCWRLGITPTEAQIKGISEWLVDCHGGSMGLTTDCLIEAGYEGASVLGDAVCGMAAIRITTKEDFLFWFRSHTANEIKWGGAVPVEKGEDGRRMHPRSSFKAFMEVVEHRCMPWEDMEMDAIHSLQLILRGSLQDEDVLDDDSKMIVSVPATVDSRIMRVDELRIITNEMVRLIETAVVPILAIDASGIINGWNTKTSELTGLAVQQAIGTPFIDLVGDDSRNVVKNMISLALEGTEERDVEINLKTFGPQEENKAVILVGNACCSRDIKGDIVGVCFVGQDVTRQKLIMEKYACVEGDYVGIVRSPCALIPPIFMMDEQGECVEWNDAMQKLSGLKREEAVNRMVVGEVFTVSSFGCRVRDCDTLTKLRIFLNNVIVGEDVEKWLFGFFGEQGNYVEALLSANKRSDAHGRSNGVLCFLQVASPELQYAMQVQKISEHAAANSTTKLAYIRQEIKKALGGIMFVEKQLESSCLNDQQQHLLKINRLCREQLAEVANDSDIESIEECYMDMKCGEFNLGKVVEAVINQVRIFSQERQVQVQVRSDAGRGMDLYGDNLRLQQALSSMLWNVMVFSLKDSSVIFRVIPKKKKAIGRTSMQLVELQFRIAHPSPGIPEVVIQEMLHPTKNEEGMSREGLILGISQKLVKIMNGSVEYVREAEKSTFIVVVEFPLLHPAQI